MAHRDPLPAPPSLRMLILATSDLDRAVRFYQQAFGWPRTVESPVLVAFSLPGGLELGLYRRDGFAGNTGQLPSVPAAGDITGTELYLHVADLPGTCQRIEAAGGRLLTPIAPRPWGDDAAYFADPDGNVVAAGSPRPAAAAGPSA